MNGTKFLSLTPVFLFAMTTAPVSTEEPAVAPRIIMIYGASLESPIYMTDWKQNLEFMLGVQDVSPESSLPASAPSLQVSLFWDANRWEKYASDPALLKTLDPKDGSRGTLYLSEPAVLRYSGARTNRVVDASAMAILVRNGLVLAGSASQGSVD